MRSIRETLFRRKKPAEEVPWVKPFNNNFLMVFASLAILERDGEAGRKNPDFLWSKSNVEFLESLGDTWKEFRKEHDAEFQQIFPLVLEKYQNAKRLGHLQVRDASWFEKIHVRQKQRVLEDRQKELIGKLNPLLENVARGMLVIGISEKKLLEMGQ